MSKIAAYCVLAVLGFAASLILGGSAVAGWTTTHVSTDYNGPPLPTFGVYRINPDDGGDGTGVQPPMAVDAAGRYVFYLEHASDGSTDLYRYDSTHDAAITVASGIVPANRFAISDDGRYAAFVDAASGSLEVADVQDGTTQTVPGAPGGPVALSADGATIAFAAGGTAHVEAVPSGATVATIAGNCHDELTLSADASTLACTSASTLHVYDVSSGDELYTASQVATGEPVSLSADGRYVAYGSDDTTPEQIEIWDRDHPADPAQTIADPSGGANEFPSLSADGSQIAYETVSDGSSMLMEDTVAGGTPQPISVEGQFASPAANTNLDAMSVAMAAGAGAIAFTSDSAVQDQGRAAPPTGGAAAFLAWITDTTAPTWSSGAQLADSNVASTTLTLTWPAASDDVGVAGYQITENGTVIGDVGARARSFDVTGLTAATSYTLGVVAYDSTGNDSGPLTTAATTSGGSGSPGSTPLVAHATTGAVTLTWGADAGAAGYRVLRDDGSGAFVALHDVAAGTTSYTDSGLLAATTYTYRVDELDGSGSETAWTTTASATTPALAISRVDASILSSSCCGAADIGSDVRLQLVGDAGRTASAVVTYDTVRNSDGSFASSSHQATTTVALDETSTGTYTGTFTLSEGVQRITSVTGTLSDGTSAHDVSAAATQTPIDVGGELDVVVQPASGDVSGATLTVTSVTAGDTEQRTVTGPGTYAFLVPAASDWTASVDGATATATIIAGRTAAVSLQPSVTSSLTISVPAGDGGVAGDVSYVVLGAGSNQLATGSIGAGTLSTTIGGLPAGESVTVNTFLGDLSAHYLQRGSATVTLQPGANTVTVTKQPLPVATLTGTVRHRDGTPLAGADVGVSQSFDGRQWTAHATTAADGTYSAPIVAATASVTVTASGFSAGSGTVDATSGHASFDVTLGSTTASLTVHALPPVGEQAGGVTVALEGGGPSVDLPAGETDATFTDLTVGRHLTVHVTVDDSSRRLVHDVTGTITLAEGANSLDVGEQRLATGTVSGIVTGGGSPIAAATVKTVVVADGRSFTDTASTGADGTYRLTIPAGTVTLTATVPTGGFHDATKPFALGAGDQVTEDVDLARDSALLVHLRLYTKDFGSEETLQPLDWRTAMDLRATLVDSLGHRIVGLGDDLRFEEQGTWLKFCADGSRVGFPAACTTVPVTPDDRQVTLELHLTQASVLTATLEARDGTPSVGIWTVALTPLDASGTADGETVTTSGAGSDVRMGVPVAGRYRLAAQGTSGTYETTIDVHDGTQLDLGHILLRARTSLDNAATSVVAVPDSVLPAQLLTVRAQVRLTAPLNNAALRLAIPAGTSLAAGGTTVDGVPVSDHVSAGFDEVSLGDVPRGMSHVVVFTLHVDATAVAGPLSADVRIKGDGVDAPVGSATAQVLGVELDVPAHVTAVSFVARGQAPAGSMVTVRNDGAEVATATAGPGGLWSATIDLGAPLPAVPQPLTAETTIGGRLAVSPVRPVTYDPTWIQPTSITVSQQGERPHTFSPTAGTAFFTMLYVPGHPVTVEATFPATGRLLSPRAWVGQASALMSCSATKCTASVPVTSETVGDVWVDYDVAPKPYDAASDIPVPTPAQLSQITSTPYGQASLLKIDGNTGSVLLGGRTMTVTVDRSTGDLPAGMKTLPNGMPGSYSLSVDVGSGTVHATVALPKSWVDAVHGVRKPAQSSGETMELVEWAIKGLAPTLPALYSTDPDGHLIALDDQIAASACPPEEKAQMRDIVDESHVYTVVVSTAGSVENVFLTAFTGGLSLIQGQLFGTAVTGAFDYEAMRDVSQTEDEIHHDIAACTSTPPPGWPPPTRRPDAHPTYLFDPSGYVYTRSRKDRLSGVTAVLQIGTTQHGPWKMWKASDYGQTNPQLTDRKGRYGWDVPKGWYRVRFTRRGYRIGYSRVVRVLPEWTHLDQNLVARRRSH